MSSGAGRSTAPLRTAAALVGLVALVVTVAAVVHDPRPASISPAPAQRSTAIAASDPPSARTDDAADLLRGMERAVRVRNRSAFVAAADPATLSAHRRLRVMYHNLAALPLADFTLRYVAEQPGRTPGSAAGRRGVDTWSASVRLTWRLAGYQHRAVTSDMRVTFVRRAGAVSVVSIGSATAEPEPIWLLERLTVRRNADWIVLGVGRRWTGRAARWTQRAVADVNAVLPGWHGPLVVVAPAAEHQLQRVLAAAPGSYREIAAVTATLDGSADPAAPVQVVLNRPLLRRLGPLGSQVVVSHEATHAATGAATSRLPLWLVEGFADYVALSASDVALRVAGRQILAQVRQHGPLRELPEAAEFATLAEGLGGAYGAAWLACRFVAAEYGQPALLRFYRVADTAGVRAAFRRVLHTTEGSFTNSWQRYLVRLAGG